MRINKLYSLLTLLLLTKSISAQPFYNGSAIQDSLNLLSSLVWQQKADSARVLNNNVFFRKFQSALESAQSIAFPFDSVNGITRVASEDGEIRIFTWNIPFSDGTNKYFGFIQLLRENPVLIPLVSTYSNPADFTTKQLTTQEWYGALYYQLIQVKIGKKMAYTLLGWDGYTSNSNRKLIDILYIDDNGNVVLGMPVFKTEKGIRSRVVLEYAEKANMLLRYDYQTIRIEKRKKIKKEKAWLIVMDRLVPMDPSMEGFRNYYVPAGDIYDGFIFRDGYWVLVEDIDVANKVQMKKM